MMKRILTLLIACAMMVPGVLFAEEKAEKPVLDTFAKKLSYAMGSSAGLYFKGLEDNIDFESLLLGITDAYAGSELAMSQQEIVVVQKEFAAKMQAKQAADFETMKEKNRAEGLAYLEENKKKEGVVVTDSGLQYQFINKGEGEMPKPSDQVKVDYVGSLIDGTEFDSSITRGEPVVFGVDQVIPGWSEALQLIPVGSKVKLVIPSELAYGEQGVMPKIEPNAVLVFEIDLHAIESQTSESPAPEKPAPESQPNETEKPATEKQ